VDLTEALAQAARELREERGVSKERVADALGKSVDTIRRFENAEVFRGLNDLADAYERSGVSLIDLLDEASSHLKNKG